MLEGKRESHLLRGLEAVSVDKDGKLSLIGHPEVTVNFHKNKHEGQKARKS